MPEIRFDTCRFGSRGTTLGGTVGCARPASQRCAPQAEAHRAKSGRCCGRGGCLGSRLQQPQKRKGSIIMTVAMAWTRRLTEQTEELVFVADSRYRGGDQNFDVCPKILTLPRSDCAICFAGDTGHALPMMLQVSEAIGSFDRATRRSQDIAPLKSHIIKICDSMSEDLVKSLNVRNSEDPTPGASFLFGGYSWINKAFDSMGSLLSKIAGLL